MKLSIVIANYNNANYLPKCLASIESYKLNNAEIVVVDDASTDSSLAVLENLKTQYPLLKVIVLPENHGPLYARLRGVEAATGDSICFIDPDDSFLSGQLAKAWATFQYNFRNYQSLVTFYGYHVVWPRRTSHYLPEQQQWQSDDLGFLSWYWQGLYKYMWGKIYARSLILEQMSSLLPLEFRHNEDVLFNYFVLLKGQPITICLESMPLLNYHRVATSVTQKLQFESFYNGVQAVNKIAVDIQQAEQAERHLNRDFYGYFLRKCTHLLRNFPAKSRQNKGLIEPMLRQILSQGLVLTRNQKLLIHSYLKYPALFFILSPLIRIRGRLFK